MDKTIKIFVSLHDDFFVADNDLLEPIQVGTVLTKKKLPSILHDDVGDNISYKNKMYCELTAQYWAWKNMPDLDYYGFFHYRRYLSFNPIQLPHYENITYFDYCDDSAIEALMLNEKTMRSLIEKYDVIYPQKNPIGGDTIYEHWCKHLEKKDIEILVQVIMEKYPEFYDITRMVLNAKEAIHCNMFIMKKDIFFEYNEWLFDILEECEKRIDFTNYSTEKLRTIGHMAERLCAIYSIYLERNGAKICYVQRSLFRNNEKNKYSTLSNQNDLVPIMLSCNNNYVKYVSVLIESIIKKSSSNHRYAISILHTDITKENMQILEEQVKMASNLNFQIEFINVKRRMEDFNNLFVDRHLSIETYFRFFAVDIYEKLDKVLYLDCDVVVNEDLANLYNIDISNYSLAAVRDVDIISLCNENCKQDIEARFNIDNNVELDKYEDYFQAGVILFNLKKIRENYSSKDFFKIALSKKWKFQDQDILNYLFKNDVYYLPLKWNTCYECFDRLNRVKKYTAKDISDEYIEAKSTPYIIHYAGTPKPWDGGDIDMATYFWNNAKNSPLFENIIHEMNVKMFTNLISSNKEVTNDYLNSIRYRFGESDIDNIIAERDDLRWRLSETRKSFSYRLGLALTSLPRKIRSMTKGV